MQTPPPSARRRQGPLAAALLLAACATAGNGEKGRLVPLDVPREKLDQHYAPKKAALLVGVNRFDDPEWNGLRYTEKDAEDLGAVLRDPQRGAFDHVEVLKDGPTRADIRAAISRLGDVARDDRDTVLVYFSSHGTLARDARGEMKRYLVTRDTRMTDVAGSALAIDDLKSEFEALRSRRKVLILAACHSGGGKSLLPGDMQKELAGTKGGFFVRPIEEVSRAIVVLAASDWGETAREDSKLENDIYTHFLVEALKIGYDRNGDGATTVSEAHDYARRMTYEFTAGRQRPSAETTEVGADPIVLVGRVQRRGKPELFSYAPRLDGFTVLVDGKQMTELPGGAAVEPGRHRIQIAKGRGPALVDDAVNLDAGERFDLEAFANRGMGAWEVAPRIGVMGFLDAKSRRDVLGTTFGAGATLTRRDWPSARVNLRVDAIGATGSGSVTTPTTLGPVSAPFSYNAFSGGVALPWRFPVLLDGRLALLAGPRLSAVYLQRSLKVEVAAPQSFFTLTPGLLGGVSYERGHFTLGAEAQVDFVLVRVDNENRSSGFAEVLFGAGWRF
jgi:caspase domain-containing protein